MKREFFRHSAIYSGMIVAGLVVAQGAQASAFALAEQSASGLGNAYAGAAAVAEDASTIFWNPAGMSKLKGNQIMVSGSIIAPSATFSNSASVPPATRPFGGTGGDAGHPALVPNFYFSSELNDKWNFGLGINVPFGLSTKYDANWVGRFQGVQSEIATINVNPSLSYKVNDSVALGFGGSYQRMSATLVNAVNVAPGGGFPEFTSNINDATSEGYGWNVGALFNATPGTRIGLAYRSSVKQTLEGFVRFTDRPAALAGAVPDGSVSTSLAMPASASASLAVKAGQQWDVLADASWTGWSSIQSIGIVRQSGAVLSTLNLGFKNTMRYSLGANYEMNDKWMLKFGVAYDQSPVPNAEIRSVRLPDNDRTWLTIGAKYKLSPANILDFGYAYIMVKDAPINNLGGVAAATGQTGNIIGTYKANVNVLSAQYTHNF